MWSRCDRSASGAADEMYKGLLERDPDITHFPLAYPPGHFSLADIFPPFYKE